MTAAARTPLEVGSLVSDYQRRPIGRDRLEFETQRVSIEEHQAWRESLAPQPEVDEIDLLVSELRDLKPEEL